VESAIGEPGVLGLADEADFGETDGLFVFHKLGEELIVLLLPFERLDFELGRTGPCRMAFCERRPFLQP